MQDEISRKGRERAHVLREERDLQQKRKTLAQEDQIKTLEGGSPTHGKSRARLERVADNRLSLYAFMQGWTELSTKKGGEVKHTQK
jgi:hypothetical protein